MDEPAARLLLTQRILHLAFMLTSLLYAAIGAGMAVTDALPEPVIEGGTAWLARGVLAVVALGNLSFVAVTRRRLSEASAVPAPEPRQMLASSLLGAALCEAIGLYGLGLLLLTGRPADVLAFVALAEVALLATFPREGQWATISGG